MYHAHRTIIALQQGKGIAGAAATLCERRIIIVALHDHTP
jgi:hypothetical protein